MSTGCHTLPVTPKAFDARSILCVPAEQERFVLRAAERRADLILLDLEDGVAPAAKEFARASLRRHVEFLHGEGASVYVRVNHVPQLLAADLAACVGAGADGIVMPKVEGPRQLHELDAELERLERADAARPARPAPTRVIALIETPLGLCKSLEIAMASPRLVSMSIGAEDFATAMRVPPLIESLSYPAQAVAVAAVAAGIHPIGLPGPVGEFTDLGAYRKVAEHARRLGIRGAICIHPLQVAVLNEVFGGTPAELAQARRIVDAFDAAEKAGKGAIALDGRMIDAPIASRARELLSRHERPV